MIGMDELVPYFCVDGEVIEVLTDFGLAHVRTSEGTVYGITRHTPGVVFDKLREGQKIRIQAEKKFSRVSHAELIG
jgi:hypothetical protein